MKNIKKINLAEVSDKQALSMDQFSKIIGGSVDDTCSSGGDVPEEFGSKYKALC